MKIIKYLAITILLFSVKAYADPFGREAFAGIKKLPTQHIWLAPATASATAYDAGQSISTTTLVSGTTTLTLAKGDYTDIITPRNVVAVVDFAVGAPTSTVTGSLLITGTNFQGRATTETLTVSTTPATGNVAWLTIESLAWTITAVSGRVDTDNALLKLGSGTKMGIPADMFDSTDIRKVIENGALTTTYTQDTTYNTITFVNAPDSTINYEVHYWYRTK